MSHPVPPAVLLFGAPGCHLCEDARGVADAHLAARRSAGLDAPPLVEVDIHSDDRLLRAFMETIPVFEVGTARLELATSPVRIRDFLDSALGAAPIAAFPAARSAPGPRPVPGDR